MKEHPKHFDTATESNGHQTSVRPIHIHFLAHSLYGQQIKRLYLNSYYVSEVLEVVVEVKNKKFIFDNIG